MLLIIVSKDYMLIFSFCTSENVPYLILTVRVSQNLVSCYKLVSVKRKKFALKWFTL